MFCILCIFKEVEFLFEEFKFLALFFSLFGEVDLFDMLIEFVNDIDLGECFFLFFVVLLYLFLCEDVFDRYENVL